MKDSRFQNRVLPLLSDRCFLCHGPDATDNDSGLRLDQWQTATGELPSGEGHAIVPGSIDKSILIDRIRSSDPDLVMPPMDSGRRPLSPEDIKVLEDWIESGAKFEKHWSWVAPTKHIEVPDAGEETWVRSAIDRFVAEGHAERGLTPTAEAPRWKWLRRVTLDLTGLPPTQAEIAAFAADTSSDAYERVVDRLLASRAFGEHLAVSWLDAARYADSFGYQSDQICVVWPYRDWVIRAINSNLPYDQFLTWQLAGDLLPNPTDDQRIATAFNRLHRQTNEGGSIDLEWRTEYAADRVNTFGSSMLGLTLECCRCHDHKLDAITQKDYYQFMSFFNNIDEYGLYDSTARVPTPSMLLPNEEQRIAAIELQGQVQHAELELSTEFSRSDERFKKWLQTNTQIEMPIPKIAIDFESRTAEHKYTSVAGGDVVASTNERNASVAGRTGNGLQFSGDDRLEIDAFSMSLFQPMSVAFWVKIPNELDNCILFHEETGTDAGFFGTELSVRDGKLFWRTFDFGQATR